MKFTLTLKDPDWDQGTLDDVVRQSLGEDVLSLLSGAEVEMLVERRKESFEDFVKQWIEDGEYLNIEFDTDFALATVRKVNNDRSPKPLKEFMQ